MRPEDIEELRPALESLSLPVTVMPPGVTGKATTEKTALVGELMEQLARDMATRRAPEGERELASFAQAITSLLVVSPQFIASRQFECAEFGAHRFSTVDSGTSCGAFRTYAAAASMLSAAEGSVRRARLVELPAPRRGSQQGSTPPR